MVISRERYLDDTRRFPLDLSLTTRSGIMHSLLTGLPVEEQQAISDILASSLDQIEARLRPYVSAAAARR